MKLKKLPDYLNLRKSAESALSASKKTAGKYKNQIFALVFGGASFAGLAQQDPNRNDNTYYVSEQLEAWTVNAASQADYDTPEERAERSYREALVQLNAFRTGHYQIAHYFPHLYHSEVTDIVYETGNLVDDLYVYEQAVGNGSLPGLTGATHILRVYGSDRNGTSDTGDLNDRRFLALNLETANLVTKAHEFAHTFNAALRIDHANALSSVPIEYYDLDGNLMNATDWPSIGVPTTSTRVEAYTTSAANSIGNPTFWGDGYVYYDNYYNGTLVGYCRVKIEDLDVDQSDSDPNADENDNVSDRIVEAINTGDPGYAPHLVTLADLGLDIDDVAPKPSIVVEDGLYKLTNSSAYENLGFDYDDMGHKFSAKIRFYPYKATNAVNDANLSVPDSYGRNYFTLQDMIDGIDKDYYDTNYPGEDIVFMCYTWGPDTLGPASDIVTTGIEDEKIAGIKLYPNPVHNFAKIESPVEVSDVIVYSLDRRIASIHGYDPDSQSLDISELAPGVYVAALFGEDNQVLKRVKIVKE